MAEQKRNLIDGHTRQEHFDREGVAEHVRVAALSFAVRSPNIRQLEDPAKAPLPVRYSALGLTVPAPEKIPRIGLRTGRKRLEGIDHDGRERHVDWRSGLGLIKQQAVAVKPVPFERDGIANTQA